MVGDNSVRRVQELRKEINHHNHRYFVLDSPVISDAEYDQLIRELRVLEEAHPELVTLDSPTQRVGAPVEGFDTARHPVPMLSLSNAFNFEELQAWYRRVENLLEGASFDMVCELKIDCLAVALTYEDGLFVRGATRGDGYEGQNVTQNLRTVLSIPLTLLRESPARLDVRGEVYMPIEDFHRLNDERTTAGEPLFVNPRNSAAGFVRQLDPRITASRSLDIFIYAVGYSEDGSLPDNQWDALEQLKGLGFKINPHNTLCRNLEDVEEFYQHWLVGREQLPYQTDGVVIKVNSFQLQQRLGVVGREPRWAEAYKFPAEQAITRLKAICINVGRTGSLNPFAMLESVNVGGATVKMATLHNAEDIQRKDIRIGDWVVVERAGEVIPQVVGPVVARRTGEERVFSMPTHCPVCGTRVIKPPGEVLHRCLNISCPAQFFELLKHFVGKSGMDIEGLGQQWCLAVIKAGLVKDVADLYYLNNEQLLGLDRMGAKLATKIMDNIERSKGRPFSRVLFALGILHVGSVMADLVVQHFNSIDELAAATDEELSAIEGIGPKIAASIAAYFREDEKKKVLEKLRVAGVCFEGESLPKKPQELPLAGLTFCITGTLASMGRSRAEEGIKEMGGSCKSSITRKTDYLVVGENPGSNVNNARKLGTVLLSEEELLQMLGRRP